MKNQRRFIDLVFSMVINNIQYWGLLHITVCLDTLLFQDIMHELFLNSEPCRLMQIMGAFMMAKAKNMEGCG